MFDAVRQPVRAAQRLGRRSLETAGTFITGNAIPSFARNDKGNVAVIFALTAAVSCFMVGGAIDIGRAYSAKT